jgi:hypothetical protein
MDLNTVFTKTAKGVTQVNQRTQSLSRELTKVLKSIDGKSTVEELAKKADVTNQTAEKALVQLQREGYTRVFEVRIEVPLTDFGGDEDFDFTAHDKLGKSSMSFGPSPYRQSPDGQVEHAPAATALAQTANATASSVVAEAKPHANDLAVKIATAAKDAAEAETVRIQAESNRLQAEAQKAQAEARARAGHEAELRARLEVEARARKEAELRAMEEAARAKAAAESARKELESKLAEERKQRESFSDTRSRLTREQIEKEAEQQRALAAARAKAETEAHALSLARAKAEAEADALALARVQAEQAAKQQAEQFAAAQRDLRQQLMAEIEAKVRAEMEPMLRSDIEESARAEVEAAILQEAQHEARRLLEARLDEERQTLAIASDKAKGLAEVDAKRMLAEQEQRIRAEMEARLAELTEEKNRVEIEARKMAEAQADAANKAATEFAHRLRMEEEARHAVEAEALSLRESEARKRTRLEARAREEAAEREKVHGELSAQLGAEKAAKHEAQARALVEQELREKAAKESQTEIESARRAREEAEQKAAAESKAREEAARIAALADAERERVAKESEAQLAEERRARAEAEKKAKKETKGREIASRAADEQTAERQRIEREAEERIAYERRAREKAEEKARLEEEAEAQQRAFQVARLKELREHNERAEQQRLLEEARKPKKARVKRNWARWGIFGTIGTLLIAAIGIQVVPLGAMNSRLEKALSGWLHDDVSVGSLRVNFLPRPHLKLEQVSVGKLLDAKADQGKLYLEFSSLFGDRFVIDKMELQGVSISQDALQRAANWAKVEGRGKGIEIDEIILSNVKLDIKGLAVEPFDAGLTLEKSGAIKSGNARAKDGRWSLSVTPQKASEVAAASPVVATPVLPSAALETALAAPAGPQWAVEFTARNMTLPLGAPIPINNLDAKGTLTGQELNLNQIQATLLEGSGTGTLRADWKQALNFSSSFGVQRVKVEKLAEVFTRDIALTGRMEGEFTASATAPSIGGLLTKPNIQGVYTLRDGAIGNLDLVQAMRSPESGGRGGQSKFAELTGQLRVADGITRFEKMKLSGGVLLANGTVAVNGATGALSGTVGSEIRSTVAQDRALFAVSGNVARPVLKRGG